MEKLVFALNAGDVSRPSEIEQDPYISDHIELGLARFLFAGCITKDLGASTRNLIPNISYKVHAKLLKPPRTKNLL